VKLASIAAAGAAAVMAATLASHASAAPTKATQAKPTVVLVNGAWTNNASWSRVIKRLQNDGYTVVAPPDPLQSWALVGTIDNAIPWSIQLFMADRAHAHITQVKAGHLSMISQPAAVTNVILAAAQSVSG
jgi:pimeloyl-ACP methyl ester carboxylesterase